MARIFYYDIGTADAEVKAGTTGGGTTFTPNDAAITNETLINDQSISGAVTGWGANDAIRFDMGESKSGTIIAFYFTSGEGTNINVHASSSATAMGAADKVITAGFVEGWNVVSLGATFSGRYWFVVADGSFDNCTEIFIGDSYTFANRFDLNNSQTKVHGIDVDRSYGNVKGSNKRFDELKAWAWNWRNIIESDKTNLETFENAIDIIRLKFIYFDETTLWWVSKNNVFDFVEQAYQIYNLNINLVQEIE